MILIWKPRCINAWQMPHYIGQNLELLIWWLIVEWWPNLDLVTILIFLSEQNVIANVIIWTDFPWKFQEIVSSFQQKKNRCIWTSRTSDMSRTLNSVWAAGQILTSPLLLTFGLPGSRIESWIPMNVLGLCLSFLAI